MSGGSDVKNANAGKMIGGRSRELSRDLVQQIVLRHIATKLGMDLLELQNCDPEVHFLDEGDQPVALHAITVTWRE